jgi:histone-lysine N-methyltransferase ASH1L
MSLSFESSFSGPPTDTSSNIASSSSTPPTTVADSASLHSDTSKHDVINVADDAVFISDEPAQPPSSPTTADEHPASGRASRRVRVAPVYNIVKLSGTAGHGKRRANGDIVGENRRHTTGDLLTRIGGVANRSDAGKSTGKAYRNAIDALDLRHSPAASHSPRTRRQTRESPRPQRSAARTPTGTSQISNLGKKLSSLGKRSRKSADQPSPRIKRELRRLEDTKEYSHIDEVPVVYTVWANGKYVDPNAPPEPPRKKVKVEEAPPEEPEKEDAEPITNTRKRRVKKYLGKGLYAGQDMPADSAKGVTAAEKKKLAQLPELAKKNPVNKTMPQPIYTGFRMLIAGRDFKLPFQVCNPMPPGQPKPDEWKKMAKSMTHSWNFSGPSSS